MQTLKTNSPANDVETYIKAAKEMVDEFLNVMPALNTSSQSARQELAIKCTKIAVHKLINQSSKLKNAKEYDFYLNVLNNIENY